MTKTQFLFKVAKWYTIFLAVFLFLFLAGTK